MRRPHLSVALGKSKTQLGQTAGTEVSRKSQTSGACKGIGVSLQPVPPAVPGMAGAGLRLQKGKRETQGSPKVPKAPHSGVSFRYKRILLDPFSWFKPRGCNFQRAAVPMHSSRAEHPALQLPFPRLSFLLIYYKEREKWGGGGKEKKRKGQATVSSPAVKRTSARGSGLSRQLPRERKSHCSFTARRP